MTQWWSLNFPVIAHPRIQWVDVAAVAVSSVAESSLVMLSIVVSSLALSFLATLSGTQLAVPLRASWMSI